MVASIQPTAEWFASPLPSVAIQARESTSEGYEVTEFHIGANILNNVPYFSAELSGRWALPDDARFMWPTMDLEEALRLLQLADMLMVDSTIINELKMILRGSMRTMAHVKRMKELLIEADLPGCVKELVEGRTRYKVAGMISDDDISKMAKAVIETNDQPTLTGLAKILSQRSRMGQEYVLRNAALLESAMKSGFCEKKSTRRQGNTIVQIFTHIGIHSMLDLLSNFVTAHSECFEALMKAAFQEWPLLEFTGTCTPEWKGFGDPRAVYKNTFSNLLQVCVRNFNAALVPLQQIVGLFQHIIEKGHAAHSLVQNPALPAALASLDLEAQLEVCVTIEGLDDSNFCAIFTSSLLQSVQETAQLSLCERLNSVPGCGFADLFSTEILQSAGAAVQLQLCKSLDCNFHGQLSEYVSADILGGVVKETRTFLCSLLPAEMTTLSGDVQAIVLAEIDEDSHSDDDLVYVRHASGHTL